MPKQVIPIEGIAEVGVIKDAPEVSLPPNAFSDARNVRFDDGAIRKMKGHEVIFNDALFTTDTDGEWQDIQHIAYWENPNKDVWVVIDRRGLIDEVWLCWFDANNVLVRSSRHTTSDQAGAVWQSTIFNGGYSIVINNGVNAPQYLSDTQNSEATITDESFSVLPNWESYTIPATDSATDTEEANPVVTASIVVAFGNLLMAGGLRETRSDGTVIRDLAGVVRSSSVATLGDIPQNWNPFATGAGTADELLLADTGRITAMRELQGKMMAYTADSIHQVDVTNQGMRTIPITKEYGALAQDSVFEFDGRHLIVGSNDIYIFAGHPGSIKSISDSRVRRYFYDNLSPVASDNLFVQRNQEYDEIWVCYPNLESRFGYCNEALIWNFRTNVWTIRDLPTVYSSTTGPLPGAGSPNASITFSGGPSGNNTKMNLGRREVQTLHIDGEILAPHNGLGQIQEFALPELDRNLEHGASTQITSSSAAIITGPTAGLSNGQTIRIGGHPTAAYNGDYTITGLVGANEIITSRNTQGFGQGIGASTIYTEGFDAEGREIIHMNITGDAGPDTVAAVYSLTADSDDNDLASLFTYNETTLNGGFQMTITDNNDTYRIAATDLSLTDGTAYSTDSLFTAIATYINSNAIPGFDWSASSDENELTLTSDVVGVRAITAATMRLYTGTTQTITGTQAAANDANNLTLVRTVADPLAATAVTGGGTDADVAGIEVVVADNGTYQVVGGVNNATGFGILGGVARNRTLAVNADTAYVYMRFSSIGPVLNWTRSDGSSGTGGVVAARGPAWQTGDEIPTGIGSTVISGTDAEALPQLPTGGNIGLNWTGAGVSFQFAVRGSRTVTTETRQRITFTNPNPFAVDLLAGSTGGARTLAATGDLDGDDSFHVQNNDTTNRDWIVSSAYINDTGTGSGYAGGFGVTTTSVTLAAPGAASAINSAPIYTLTLTGAGTVDVTTTMTWRPDSTQHFAAQVPTGLAVQFLLDGVQMGAYSGGGTLNPTFFSGPTVRNSVATAGTGTVTMRVTGSITGTTTLNYGNENAGLWSITTNNNTGNTGYDITFANNNNVSTTISSASRAGGALIAAGLRTFAATGATRTRQVGNDVANNTWTIAFEATERSTWTATNNRTEATNHVQSDVFSYDLTVDGTTYDLGDIDDNGNTASVTVIGTTATATYSAQVNGTTAQTFNITTDADGNTNVGPANQINIVRSAGTGTPIGTAIVNIGGANAPQFYTGNPNNLQIYEGTPDNRAPNTLNQHGMSVNRGTYTTPYAGTLHCIVCGGGGSASWSNLDPPHTGDVNSRDGRGGGGAGAVYVTKTVASGENYTVFCGQGGTGHGDQHTHSGRRGGQSRVTGPAGFDIVGQGSQILAGNAIGRAQAGGSFSVAGTGVTTVVSGNGTNGGIIGGANTAGGLSGLRDILTYAAWSERTQASPTNSLVNAWDPAGYTAATGTWTTNPTTRHFGGWGDGGEAQTGVGGPAGGHGAGGIVLMWMTPPSYNYAATRSATTGPATITHADGTDITDVALTTTAQTILSNTANDQINVQGNYTVVNATSTSLTNPTDSEVTAGIGIYGISQEDSPSIQMSWEHGVPTDSDYFNIDISPFESTDDTQAELTRHVYDYLITFNQFQGLDPSIDGVVQPDDAIYYPEYDSETNTMRFERVTTGNHPDSHVVGAFDYYTELNGVRYPETAFGGNVTDSVTITVQGQTGSAPPVIRVADPTAGNYDVIVGGSVDRNGVASALRNAIHRSTSFQASGANNNLVLTREEIGPNTNVAVMSKHDDDDSVLPTPYGGTFIQTRAGFDPQTNHAQLTLNLNQNWRFGVTERFIIDLDGTDGTTLSAHDIAILVAAGIDSDAVGWTARDSDSDVIITSDSDFAYYRMDNGYGTGEADINRLWTWDLNDQGDSLRVYTDPLSDEGRATETVSGIHVQYSQPTFIRITYSDATTQDYLYGGAYEGALPNNAMYHNDPYIEPETQSYVRRNIDYINLDMRNEITTYADRRLNVIANTTNNTLRALPTQYGEHAFYFRQWDLINPGNVAPDTDALLVTIPDSDSDDTNFDTTQSLELTYDLFRPWPKNEVNKSKNFMIMSGETNLFGMDLTYGFADTDIISYVQRDKMHMQPTKDVEMLSGLYIDADGELHEDELTQMFTIRVEAQNNAAIVPNLMGTTTLNATYPYMIGGDEPDYKADVRVTGRMVSYRIENTGQSRWDIGGLALEVGKGGTR